MSERDVNDRAQAAQPSAWDADAHAAQADIRTPNTGFTNAAQWGLASLFIGCTLLLAACIILVFNVLLFRGGPAGIPVGLAFMGGLIGTAGLSALGLASFMFGVYGWRQAHMIGSSPALAVAGVFVSLAGLMAWLIAAIDLLMILLSFFHR
jgi:hypothetical protein